MHHANHLHALDGEHAESGTTVCVDVLGIRAGHMLFSMGPSCIRLSYGGFPSAPVTARRTSKECWRSGVGWGWGDTLIMA